MKWSFYWKVWHDTWAIDDNGKIVIWIAWKYLHEEDIERPCVAIFDWKGIKRIYSYQDISIPRKYKPDEMGPIGDFWRIWHTAIIVKNEAVIIQMDTGSDMEITLTDGVLRKSERGDQDK